MNDPDQNQRERERRVAAELLRHIDPSDEGPFDGPQVVDYAMVQAIGAIDELRARVETLITERDFARHAQAAAQRDNHRILGILEDVKAERDERRARFEALEGEPSQ